jgi:hypothetical protein
MSPDESAVKVTDYGMDDKDSILGKGRDSFLCRFVVVLLGKFWDNTINQTTICPFHISPSSSITFNLSLDATNKLRNIKLFVFL